MASVGFDAIGYDIEIPSAGIPQKIEVTVLDFTNQDNVQMLLGDIGKKPVGAVHLGTDCRTFCAAPWCFRDASHVEGLPNLCGKHACDVEVGDLLARNRALALTRASV